MRVLFTSAVLVGMLGLAAAPVAAQPPLEASLSFVSDPGDYIGAGQTRSFTLDTASFSSRSGQNGGSFGVTVFPFAGGFWFLDIAAPQGAQLVPGAYEGAVRYPFQGPGQPGLSLSGDGRGCNTLTGRFDVLEATFGPNGFIERFHATFEQHCEGGPAALFGEVLIVVQPEIDHVSPGSLESRVFAFECFKLSVSSFGGVCIAETREQIAECLCCVGGIGFAFVDSNGALEITCCDTRACLGL